MNKIYLIGFVYVDKPSFPYLPLVECGFYINKNEAQQECDRRNKSEKETAKQNLPGFTEGFWSVRECHENK